MSGDTHTLESKTVAKLLRNAPAGLIWIAGFLLFAGALIRAVYWAAIFWHAYSGAVLFIIIFSVFLVAAAFGALRLFLMLTSGRDFLSSNAVSGWVGLLMSLLAYSYDIYDSYIAALAFDNDNPETFLAMFGFISVVHTWAFAMEIRLVMTMFSDVLVKKRAEENSFEEISNQYASQKAELERKLLEAQAARTQAFAEAEKQKQDAKAEVLKNKQSAEQEVLKWKQEAEAERKARIEAETGSTKGEANAYADFQRIKLEKEAAEKKAEAKISELNTTTELIKRKLETSLSEVEKQKQEIENWKQKSEAQEVLHQKLKEQNRTSDGSKNGSNKGSETGSSLPGISSDIGSIDPRKTEAIKEAIKQLRNQNRKITQEVISEVISSENLFPGGISSKTVGNYLKALQIQYK
jgi:hypothetical protein